MNDKKRTHLKTFKRWPIFVHLFKVEGKNGPFLSISISRQYLSNNEVKFAKGDMDAYAHLDQLMAALSEVKAERDQKREPRRKAESEPADASPNI